jgi:hypothetical protein
MKISKFREIDNCEESAFKENVKLNLSLIKTEITDSQSTSTSQLKVTLDQNQADLINELQKNNTDLIDNQNLLSSNLLSSQQTQHESIADNLTQIKQGISGLQPRTDTTKIYNQKFEEDIVILESSDELFEVPNECAGIFNPTSNLTEINQQFILEESTPEDRCHDRKFNFDTDQKHAIRLDSYLGDADGYIDLSGSFLNKSSDILIMNDTLYKIRVRINDDPNDVIIEDGFNIGFNDLEENNILSTKREHTISGYTLRYIVESKMNS